MPSVEQLLDELVRLEKERINLERLSARRDFGNFLDWAIRQGRARKDLGAYALSITAGDTTTIASANPRGYVWIPHLEVIWTETAGVMAAVLVRDGETFLTAPAVPAEFLFNWNTAIPWKAFGIIKGTASIAYTNGDTVTRWVIAGYVGTYLLYEEYLPYMDDIWAEYPRQWRKYDV